jgi:hypothetical protein
MEAAEQTDRSDEPHGLHRPMQWRVVVERKMRAGFIVVGRIMCQQLAEVPFPEHHDMVEACRAPRLPTGCARKSADLHSAA